ncbi:MAG: hypothetical protein JO309_09630 [Pseudonocardiales bacterium]|nr:hypothetical protein [Pseudonocardiales bacterium]MBV9729646.1 hypothetical protein [Pseudonocardiales bacterium]
MAQHVARRRWAPFVVVFVVLAGAVGAGVLVRDLQPAAGVARHGSTGNKAAPRPPEPGSATVVLVEDVALHPDADQIRKVLQKYFDAINAGDYQLWRSAVIPQWARDLGEGAWHGQYRSTLDGSIVVHRLERRAGGGLVALTSFTSLQNPADAPPELPVRCLRWWVSYPLIGEGDQLRLGPSSPSMNLRAAC